MSSKKNTPSAESDTSSTLVPKLRFPEFEGEWEVDALSKISTVVMGSSPKSEFYNECQNGLPLLQGNADVKNRQSAPRVFTSDVTKECQIGDILISVRAPVGAVAKSIHHACIGRGIAAIRAKKPNSQEFIYQRLLSHEPRWVSVSQGGTFDAINSDDLKLVELAIPQPAEQQRIASCLSSLDELITAQAQKVEALKTHKKGLMQQLFPREGETQPRLRFPEFEGAWEESPLSDFILTLDAGVSVNSHDRPATTAEFGVLKTSAVTNGVFEPEENKVVWEESEQSRLKESVRGDTIIISRMNTPALVGANAYVAASHANLFLPDRLWAAKPHEGVSLRFVSFILGSERGRYSLSKLAKGSSGSMKNITKPEVLALTLMAPTLPEQQRIASCLSSLDELITNESSKLDVYKTHKKGLMQGLFPKAEENN